jgi:hypothetical protein
MFHPAHSDNSRNIRESSETPRGRGSDTGIRASVQTGLVRSTLLRLTAVEEELSRNQGAIRRRITLESAFQKSLDEVAGRRRKIASAGINAMTMVALSWPKA